MSFFKTVNAVHGTLWLIVGLLTTPALARDPRLAGIAIAPPAEAPYARVHDFGTWKHGRRGDCLDTRGQAIAAASKEPVSLSVTEHGHCIVLEGRWRDPYTEAVFTHAHDMDVDHVVPLKEAWVSGAWAWPREKRVKYANDLANVGHLLVVSAHENRAKGDKDPARWMPPDRTYWCAYLDDWIAIKRRWALSMDEVEAKAIDTDLRACPPKP